MFVGTNVINRRILFTFINEQFLHKNLIKQFFISKRVMPT